VSGGNGSSREYSSFRARDGFGSVGIAAQQVVDATAQVSLRVRVVDVAEELSEGPQRQYVDVEVVLSLDPVAFGGAVLTEQDQRRGVGPWVENSRLSRMNGYGSNSLLCR